MKCKICGRDNQSCFKGNILAKYNAAYYHCMDCDFIQTEEPYWLSEAYFRPINISDTGYMARNQYYARRLTILLYLLFGKDGKYLDYAGGYGVMVRLMRDIGFDFYWYDKYSQNIFATGFEWDSMNKVDAVTLFEVFEHFVEPMVEVEKLLDISDTIIFSTDLHPNPVPKPNDWWYYGLEHGQHIAFYSAKTFYYIAARNGLNYMNMGSFHILSKNKVSFWKLGATKLSKIGLDKLAGLIMTPKTWLDSERMIK